LVVAFAVVTLGCGQKPVARVAIEDKVYTVTPDEVQVKTGVVTGSITELKVTERVEQRHGARRAPAKLTGKLKLTNSSADQSVRLIGGKILYIDDQGALIKMRRRAPNRRSSSRPRTNSTDRLDPDRDSTQTVEVDSPPAALKARS
jgi:hypothetical protein